MTQHHNLENVPFSAGFEPGLPSPEVARLALRGLRGVVANDGPLPLGALRTLRAYARWLRLDADVAALAPAEPSEVAAGIVDVGLRVQVVRAAVVAALMDGRPRRAVAARLRRLSRALDTELVAVREVAWLARGHHRLARLSVLSRFWVRDELRRRVGRDGIGYLLEGIATFVGLFENPRRASRFVSLRALPVGTLGRELVDFYDANGFALPGERGATPEAIMLHDLSHVLAGYGTDPMSEVQAACFQGGYRRTNPFAMVMFVLLQFHLGLRCTPGAPAEVGQVDPDLAIDAVRRGAAMNRDVTDGVWDPWPVMNVPVRRLCRDYHLPPPRRAA